MRVGIIGAMSGQGRPRVAITGIGVVSPYGVGRDCFWRHVSRGCSATRSIVDFDASPFPCTVAAPVPPVTIDDGVVIDASAAGDRRRRPAAPDPRRYSKASLIAVHRRARSVGRCRAAPERAGRRGARRQRRRRHRRRRAAVRGVLHRRLEARHAVRHSGLDRRDGLERDFDRAGAARHQPRGLDRVHELDRRHRATPRR